jgi:hypothetical protein
LDQISHFSLLSLVWLVPLLERFRLEGQFEILQTMSTKILSTFDLEKLKKLELDLLKLLPP